VHLRAYLDDVARERLAAPVDVPSGGGRAIEERAPRALDDVLDRA
jgi:hypothetical protein